MTMNPMTQSDQISDAETAPFVSVIVLNLNGEKVLGRCLEHLMRQTYQHFEIIVVDNGSHDRSLELAEQYLTSGKLSIVRSSYNRGCPGGRNLGMLYATGDLVAFIDNDGYADPEWLAAVVQQFAGDQTIGAVASVVFFANKPSILNGTGGTLNLQGYGGDHCFKTPYEFAEIPDEVLYPMGCGMVIRKHVLDQAGRFDQALVNYYDDVELGIRVWKIGYRVVVARGAHIAHELSFSDTQLNNKAYLCQKGRIRTAIKYYPLRRLIGWFGREVKSSFRYPYGRKILLKAWIWNAVHLISALGWRLRFGFATHAFWHLLYPSWQLFPPALPQNEVFAPDADHAGNRLALNEQADSAQLNFGWYYLEHDGVVNYRWVQGHASALFRFVDPVRSFSIVLCTLQPDQHIRACLRRVGETEWLWEGAITVSMIDWEWQRIVYPCPLEAGLYELVLITEKLYTDQSGRMLGVAVSGIEFD